MDHLEHAARASWVIGQSPWAVHGLRDVRDVPAAPETDLVAEDPEAARPPSADGAFGNDSAVLAAPVMDRRLLDHEFSLWDLDLQRGVVEVAHGAPFQASRHRLVKATVEPYEMPAGAQR